MEGHLPRAYLSHNMTIIIVVALLYYSLGVEMSTLKLLTFAIFLAKKAIASILVDVSNLDTSLYVTVGTVEHSTTVEHPAVIATDSSLFVGVGADLRITALHVTSAT